MARLGVMILGLAFAFFAFGPAGEAAPKRVIAIMPIALKADAIGAAGGPMNLFALIAAKSGRQEAIRSAEGTGSAATDMLITALSKSGEFVLVERGQAEKLLQEQGFGLTGAVDAGSAAKIGKILGAQAVVLGSVTELAWKSGGFQLGGWLGTSSQTVRGALDIRLVDVETGKVLMAETASAEETSSSAVVMGIGGGTNYDATLAGQVLRAAIDRLVPKIVASGKNVNWTGRVAAAKEGVVYLVAGQDIGLKPGDLLNVVREGNEIKDPTTGAVLFKDTQRIGKIQVTGHLGDKVTTARLIEGQEVQPKDVVQYIPPPAPVAPPQPAPAKKEEAVAAAGE